ncbi:MAG: hypothetical protein IIW40_03065, partial [Clostridia bacterium]|nr:hypothetical protein [Clostridia bacterium]
GKVTRGGATKPLINFALTEGADVCFSEEVLGEVFGSGSPEFIRSDNGLAAVLEDESLKWTDRLTDEALKFTAASVTLYNDLSVNFKVDGSVLAGYEDPFVKFSFGGVETTSEDYVVDSGKYVFRFRDIAPNRIGDTITATLYAYQNGVLCQGATLNYSVKQYCYNILTTYNDVDYPGRAYGELRTLLVDLLNYGAAAQTYTNYSTDALVNGDLLGKQLTWGTATDPAVSNAAAAEDQDVETPTVTWAAVGLTLDEAVTLRLGFLAESTEGLSVKFTLNGKVYEVTEFQDMTTENGHYVYFGELNAAQMRQEITAAVYRNGQQVSNTVHYNVEAYVANHANDGNALAELVKAMIRYGDAAEAFVN